ncbi:MAG TPA: GNAT family N-acetyltransferase [Micromonosporaceae bacterium]
MRAFLVTERLVLRRFTAHDSGQVYDLDNDPAVMRYLNGGRPVPRELIERESMPRLLAADTGPAGPGHTAGFWAAIERRTGEFLGWFEFRVVDPAEPDVVELGYRLRSAAWGRGYATEGSRALIRNGFTELGVRRVVATTMAVNLASRRVLEKAGLTLVRTFHETWAEPIDGAEHGEVEYALTSDQWRRHNLATP